MMDPKGLEMPQAMQWNMVADMEFLLHSFNKQHLSTQLMKAIQDLNIQPHFLERIIEVIEQTVLRANLKRQPARDPPTMRIRIWSPAAQGTDGGWGFFLVENPRNVSPKLGEMATYIVDLFLYQEQCS